jgi:hypothetical protein
MLLIVSLVVALVLVGGFLVWILMDMLSPHRAKGTWGEVAEQTGLTHIPSSARFSLDPGRLNGRYRGRGVEVRGYNVMMSSQMRMVVRVSFLSPLGPGLRLGRDIHLTPVDLAKPEGTSPVSTGDAAFDHRFDIVAVDTVAASTLLKNERVHAAILEVDGPAFGLVIDDRAIVHGSAELQAEPAELIALLDRLCDLAELVEEAAR